MVDKRFVVAIFGFGSLVAGCGNQPLRLARDVVVDGDLTVRGDVEVGDDLAVVNDAAVDGSLDVGDDLTVGDDVVVGDDIEFGGEIVELPEPPPPPPPPVIPPPPPPICGNWVVESGEQCDSVNLGGQTCLGYGFDGGLLTCNANCTINFSQCAVAPPPPPLPPPAISATIIDLTRPIVSDHSPAGLSTGDQIRYEIRVWVNNGDGGPLALHYLLYDNTVSDSSFTAPVGNGEATVMFVRNLVIATPFANDCFQVRRNGVAVSGNPVCFSITVALGL